MSENTREFLLRNLEELRMEIELDILVKQKRCDQYSVLSLLLEVADNDDAEREIEEAIISLYS